MSEETYNPLDTVKETNIFEPYLVDVRQEPRPKRFLFSMGGVGFFPLGNIQAIKAKAKNGKTQLTKILAASAVCGKCMGIECLQEGVKVLICDTEQDPDDCLRVNQGVLTLCGQTDDRYKYNEPCDRLIGLTLRNVQKMERFGIIQKAVEYYRPTFVIIDGVRDLVRDFNDLDESAEMVEELMRMSTEYECAIVNILHQNKNDENMRGHLGTEMVNKVTDVFETVKEFKNGVASFAVTQTETRNQDVEKFVFGVDEHGVPCAPEMGQDERDELRRTIEQACEELRQRREELGEDGRPKYTMKRADLVDVLIRSHGYKKTRAYELVKEAEQQNFIEYDTVTRFVIFRGKNECPF